MLGRNPVRQQELTDGQQLWIQSIYYTLQGEGPFTGHPAVFIRLAGCNLKCYWCDTDFESSQWRPSLTELLERVKQELRPNCRLIVITGGEPFRQNITPLINELLAMNLKVQIETNGTLWLDLPANANLHIVCSPKTPQLNDQLLARVNSFKYVIAEGEVDPSDGLPNMCTQQPEKQARIARPPQGSDIYVMPQDSGNAQQNVRNQKTCVDIALRFGYKLTLQTHKILEID